MPIRRRRVEKVSTARVRTYQGNLWSKRPIPQRFQGKRFVFKYSYTKDKIKYYTPVGHEHLGEFTKFEIANFSPVQFEFYDKKQRRRR